MGTVKFQLTYNADDTKCNQKKVQLLPSPNM